MFLKIRKRASVVAILLIALISLGAYHASNLPVINQCTLEFCSSRFKEHDERIREQVHFATYKFGLTKQFKYHVGGWDKFAARPHNDKCLTFFKFIDTHLPNWEMTTLDERIFEKNIVKKQDYFDSVLGDMKRRKSRKNPPGEVTEDDKYKVNEMFLNALKDSITTEQEMADTMTIIRLFGHCFYKGSKNNEGELESLYTKYSRKIVPFFKSVIPQLSLGQVETNSEWHFGDNAVDNVNILDYYYKNMQGSGIVLSTATRHSRDLVKFIHVLRALGNTLPVEILHRSDLSKRAKQAILLAGSSSREELLGDEMRDKKVFNSALKYAGLNSSHLEDLVFPKQKITLINVQASLGNMEAKFRSYNNKVLALFFNSFEKVLLFDADVVPLISPESLIALKEFTSTGAYFFKDRALLDRNDWIETNFFAKLMPHETNRIDMAMGIQPVTNHTMHNPYMKGWRHCQEAGLVMLDRKRHFSSLLALFPLALWEEPISSSIWGDKEMYWLSMSMVGDEDYTLNHYGAASVGELTPETHLKHYTNSKALELCSSHPGHLSPDGQLLWINSGFSYCKMNDFSLDELRFPFKHFENRERLRSLYENPLKIRHAISPPEVPALRTPGGTPDLGMERAFIKTLESRKKDVDQISDSDQINTHDPQKGWVKSGTCTSYQYCAYNAIESLHETGVLDESGSVFRFSQDDYERYDVLGAIWLSSIRVSSLRNPSKSTSDRLKVGDTSRGESSAKSQSQSGGHKSGTENTIHEKLKVVDHPIMDPAIATEKSGEKKKASEYNSQTKSDTGVHFDPSKVKLRPEAFNEEVKAALINLLSSGDRG